LGYYLFYSISFEIFYDPIKQRLIHYWKELFWSGTAQGTKPCGETAGEDQSFQDTALL
jgi:hypothetical protein